MVRGDPVRRVVLAAREVGAERVHVAADFGPYGTGRDEAVEHALAEPASSWRAPARRTPSRPGG